MKKLEYKKVKDSINNHLKLNNIDQFRDDADIFNCIILGLVDSINENIEPDWKGRGIKFINKVFIFGKDNENKKHSFEIGDIHKCVQDCGDSINILIDGEFVEIFKDSIRLVDEE